ncbi:MAG: 50S ribosomal protein L4 [Candidatus Moranbacteria bacterium]|nr:50S ribosomal protein L4 [Candidatus Moranbacteria bacterium]
MAKIAVYNLQGKKVEELELSKAVFEIAENDALVHQVFESIRSNQRQVLAHTKTRGERAGSGIKPWKQKGTGRARVGSVRSPIWRKGGIAFGPTNDRNFKKDIPKKMNIKAILAVLSGKFRDGELKIVDTWKLPEIKTKKVATAVKNLKIKGSALITLADSEKDSARAARNIAQAKNILTSQLNVLDMLNHKNIIMSKESVQYLENKYGKK